MLHLSTAFLITALVIAVVQDGARGQYYTYDKTDQVAEEAKNRAVTIIVGPKYVTPPGNTTQHPDRLSSKPKSKPPADTKPKYGELPRIYYQNLPPLRNHYQKPLKILTPNSQYKYHKVIPLQPNRNQNQYYSKQQLVFAASTGKPSIAKSPKFSLPVETINGLRSDFVRPPHHLHPNATTTTSTTTVSTTTRHLRTKRIWPKYILDKMNAQKSGLNSTSNSTKPDYDLQGEYSNKIYVVTNRTATTIPPSTTKGPYRRVTRVPKKKPTTLSPANFTQIEQNDWVPIVPSHFTNKVRKTKQPVNNRRSDVFMYDFNQNPYSHKRNRMQSQEHPNPHQKRMLYYPSYGFPAGSQKSLTPPVARKHLLYNGKKLNQVYYGSRRKPGVHIIGDLDSEASSPNFVTRIKHHHHHHHHRYIKTVEKPVKVEVPKPVPVPVPVPVKVEKKVPYPVHVKVPHPVPVKVIEKQYIPKPYPVYQQVPVIQHVTVEKKVPYPVRVEVPVEKQVPYPVTIEKKVPYPVPVRVMVPQPYPVETKVPYPVKEPVEIVRHVAVRVPVPQPYPVKVPQPVPVPFEKKVPYPVEVERKVPVPVRVLVPEKVEVEKKVPVYVPSPYPVEKKVHVPVRIPFPVRVPIKVPVGVPIIIHPSPDSNQVTSNGYNPQLSHYAYSVNGNFVTSDPNSAGHDTVTFHGNTVSDQHHGTVTVHGNVGFNGFNGFQSRSDNFDDPTTPTPYSTDAAQSSETISSTSAEIAATTGALEPSSEESNTVFDVTTVISR